MKTYESYKESGLEHIGKIPINWKVVKLKFIGDALTGITYSPNDIVDDCLSGKLVLRSSNIQNGKLALDNNVYVDKDFNDKYIAREGDILLCSRNGSRNLIGKNIIIKDELIGETWGAFMTVYRTEYSDFVYYFFNSTIFKSLASLFLSSTINQLTIGVINNFTIAIPPKEEQAQISNYLDYKTAIIDALIEKKEQLIQKLQAQRQAIINEAVTKGLNTNAKMKDSGMECLGEIPEHWEVIKFRYKFNTTKGLTITKSNLIDKGIPCVNYGEIHSKYGFEVIPEIHNLKCVSEDYIESNEGSLLSKGNFVFADTSEDIEGSGNFTHLNSDIPTFAGYHTIVARLIDDSDYRFIAYFLDSITYRTQIQNLVKGVKVYSITNKILKDTFLFFPPNAEQKDIAQHLDNEVYKIFASTEKLMKSIKKLKSYRQSLISEAVTGKIDVRDWQPKAIQKV